MRKFTVDDIQNGKHVVKAACEAFSSLEPSMLYKALKHKDIRVDGKKISSDMTVFCGQEVEIWLPDECFKKSAKSKSSEPTKKLTDYKIVAQTDNLMIVNKRQGLAVHGGKGTSGDCLIDIIRKDTRNSEMDLCHRIDMNTGGLVMLAKNKAALEDAITLFKEDLLIKRYRCLVLGVPSEGEPVVCEDEAVMKEVSAFLEKIPGGSVFIHDEARAGDLPITSRYRILRTFDKIGPDGISVSELEVELVTGRTHQIRAQFAHMGYPIIGDGNYGRNKQNTFFKSNEGGKVKYQQLFATTLLLRRIPKSNIHNELSGRSFSIVPRYDVDIKGLNN